ncbi:MAG TPA: DUF5076 domain-containing protein [Xanthobacteraceae bacterium]|nr:DUF5076 domain-containing protein [Xanthobacteraceae bacterium]
MAAFDALTAPPTALEKGGTEVLRAAIVEGGLHVSLRRAFEDPQAWGMILADLTRHVARIYNAEDGIEEAQTIARIRDMFDAEMDSPTDPGVTGAMN